MAAYPVIHPPPFIQPYRPTARTVPSQHHSLQARVQAIALLLSVGWLIYYYLIDWTGIRVLALRVMEALKTVMVEN